METITGDASSETLLLVRGTADVVAASNLGIGASLIICSSIKDKKSLRKVLLGRLSKPKVTRLETAVQGET